jgi:RHS repeat-associated protein
MQLSMTNEITYSIRHAIPPVADYRRLREQSGLSTKTLAVNDTINGTSAGIAGYTYDLLNRVTKLTQGATGVQSKRVDMTYNAVNQLSSLSRYSGTTSVVDTTYTYDNNQRLIQLSHKKGVSTVASYGYGYDDADKLATTVSSVDGTSSYSYDETNQLTGADNTTQADEAYSYDANGNRTSGGTVTSANNQLLSDGTYRYVYDGEGNRTKRTEIATGKVTEYVWDYRNRLTSVLFKDAGGVVTKTIDYIYDGNNQRIGKRIDGAITERYVIDRNQIALVFDGAGVQTHRYLYGTQIDQVLADETTSSTNWFLGDNQGSIRDVVDGNGTVIDHVVYDSFGKVQSQSNAGYELRFGYTGREQDAETGLDYYRARYYDASNGRFISEDPLSFEAGDGNLTRYVGNSPVNFNDPSGERFFPVAPPRQPARYLPISPRNFPGTGTPRQPGVNPYRPNVPGYTNYQNNNSTPSGPVSPTCVHLPGQTCNPNQFDPNAQLDQIKKAINPNVCPNPNYKEKEKDPQTRDFAHSTSLDNIGDIMINGLNTNKAAANSRGGQVNRPGSFFTIELTENDGHSASDKIGFVNNHFGLRMASMPGVLIMKISAKVYTQLEQAHQVEKRLIPGAEEYTETIFKPGSFGVLNNNANFQVIDLYKKNR